MNSRTMPVLVVDLDGTLLKSDIRLEIFWSALGRGWQSPFLSASALLNGRVALKEHLVSKSTIDVTNLPYYLDVIAYVESYRKEGGRTALVTTSNHTLAQSIAEHLNIFDEVHGSDRLHNLEGEIKAEFLSERFGKNEFAYMGDSDAGLHVWKHTQKIITVNASQSQREKAEAMGKPFEHLMTFEPAVLPYAKALRPHQWLKNILIFVPYDLSP